MIDYEDIDKLYRAMEESSASFLKHKDASVEDIEVLLEELKTLMQVQKEINDTISKLEGIQKDLDSACTLEEVINEIKKEINE